MGLNFSNNVYCREPALTNWREKRRERRKQWVNKGEQRKGKERTKDELHELEYRRRIGEKRLTNRHQRSWVLFLRRRRTKLAKKTVKERNEGRRGKILASFFKAKVDTVFRLKFYLLMKAFMKNRSFPTLLFKFLKKEITQICPNVKE
jgi:hypothetical protein